MNQNGIESDRCSAHLADLFATDGPTGEGRLVSPYSSSRRVSKSAAIAAASVWSAPEPLYRFDNFLGIGVSLHLSLSIAYFYKAISLCQLVLSGLSTRQRWWE